MNKTVIVLILPGNTTRIVDLS